MTKCADKPVRAVSPVVVHRLISQRSAVTQSIFKVLRFDVKISKAASGVPMRDWKRHLLNSRAFVLLFHRTFYKNLIKPHLLLNVFETELVLLSLAVQ